MSPPVAKAYMFFQRPIEDVFAAFSDAEITKKFWFNHAHGQIGADEIVLWHWQARGVSVELHVRDFVPNERIVFDWNGLDQPTQVEMIFKSHGKDGASVAIECSGFSGENAVAEAIAATEGFALLLAEASVWLEHDINAHLALHFPPGPKLPTI